MDHKSVSATASDNINESDSSSPAAPVRKPQALIVEDNKVNQLTLRKMLQRCGVEVELADDGLLGVSACQKKRFDLILMDLSMPNLDGYGATREIISNCPLNKETPIVAVSANSGQGMESRCFEVGMRDFVPKPLRLERVQAMVEEYLNS